MKKLLVVLLTLALCISLASCEFINNIINGQQQEEVEYNAAAAADYVYNLYKNKSVTAADFEVTAVANIAGVKHTVEWSVNTDKVTITKKNDTTYIVNVDEESAEELAYVLTATVKGGDQVATKTFNLTVPKYELTSFEAYMAAKEGDNVVVKGIVVAINSKSAGNKYNHLFLADLEGKGGYYCYSMATDPIADDGIELGMTVEVSGPVTPYSGMQEIKGGTVRIVDSSKKDVAVLDITEKVVNGESLANYVGLPVTIKGVEIAGQELDKETSQYLNFKLGEKTAYVRTYVTDFPTTLPVAEKANIDAAHAEHFGWLANATGILVLYNSNPYLIPMGTDCFEYLNKIEKTPEQKIADTLAQLTIGSLFNSNTEITLPAAGAAYTDVALAWTTSDATNAAIADGKLTIVIPNTAVEVTITVTATCEGKTATKEFKATLTKMVDPDTFLAIPQANEIGILQGHNTYTAGKYFVTGTVKSIANTTYGNLYIQDADGNELYVYGLYTLGGSTRFDAMEAAPQVGDTVIVYGVIGQYNGTAQMKNAWLVAAPAADSEMAAASANALGLAQGHNKYTEGKYYVTGKVVEVASTKYGNLYIEDAKGVKLYVYGLWSADGATRYDAMEVAPQVGDTITVYGILGQYNGGAQMKNGWMTAYTAATPEEDNGGEDNTDTPVADGSLATFTFGENGEAAHVDGNDLGATATYTAGDYTLNLTDMSKVYGPAFDLTGISCIKLGTSSKTGTLSFVAPEGVNKVVIRIAAYKANNAKVTVNGTEYDISANKSNDGSYYSIEINTTTTKTVKLETVSGACRAMIDSIAYFA